MYWQLVENYALHTIFSTTDRSVRGATKCVSPIVWRKRHVLDVEKSPGL